LGLDIGRLREHLRAIGRPGPHGCTNAATGRRIAAVVPVHIFGHPIDHSALDEVAREFGLRVVTDATESLGSSWRGKPAASYGEVAVLSFNGNKVITTGGGGAIVTRDAALAAEVRHLATTAKKPHRWAFDHDRIGLNYRLPSINAALGVAQLERLEQFVAEKRQLAERYARALEGMDGMAVMREQPGAISNYWLVAVKLSKPEEGARDALLAALHEAGLKCRPLWTPMHQLPMYRESPRMADLSCAEDMSRRIICLPSSPRLARAPAGSR
jgi:perosamine synthetase